MTNTLQGDKFKILPKLLIEYSEILDSDDAINKYANGKPQKQKLIYLLILKWLANT